MDYSRKRKVNHKQSKYLTFMLIPDSTTTKVRSLKVPHWFLYMLLFTALSIAAVIAVLGGLNSYSQRKLAETAVKMEETLVETAKIVEETNQERKELLDQKARVEAQKRGIEGVLNSQQGDFDQQIEFYIEQLAEIEARIAELEQQAKESYDKMNVIGSPVSKEFAETFMGGHYKPTFEEDMKPTDKLNLMLATVSVECDSSKEFLTAYAEDVNEFINFRDCFPNIWPVRGRVTSECGDRTDPFTGGAASHTGIDIKAATGTRVAATADGTVTRAEYASGYGNLVVISHGYGYETYYAHNSELLVEPGDRIKRGDYIALSGNTGRSTGPHVHYEIRYRGVVKNPRNYFGLLTE